jgi:hypothetical protein
MTHNTAHVFNCCALIACGLVLFLLQCFSLSGVPDGYLSGIGLWPLVTAALLVTTGCIGLVGYVARSLVCGLIYVVGVIVFQLEGASTTQSNPLPLAVLELTLWRYRSGQSDDLDHGQREGSPS